MLLFFIIDAKNYTKIFYSPVRQSRRLSNNIVQYKKLSSPDLFNYAELKQTFQSARVPCTFKVDT